MVMTLYYNMSVIISCMLSHLRHADRQMYACVTVVPVFIRRQTKLSYEMQLSVPCRTMQVDMSVHASWPALLVLVLVMQQRQR